MNAFVRTRRLTDERGQPLIDAAGDIIDRLDG
jgi:hypothetical protein